MPMHLAFLIIFILENVFPLLESIYTLGLIPIMELTHHVLFGILNLCNFAMMFVFPCLTPPRQKKTNPKHLRDDWWEELLSPLTLSLRGKLQIFVFFFSLQWVKGFWQKKQHTHSMECFFPTSFSFKMNKSMHVNACKVYSQQTI